LIITESIIGTAIIIICIVYCIAQHLQNRDLKKQYIHTVAELTESVDQKSLAISKLFELVTELSEDKAKYKSRTEELEKAIETGFGISVRKNITIINTNLLKLDYVAMLAGVERLLKDSPSSSIEDAEYYITLIRKLQTILDTMPEIQEEKGADEINAI